MSIEEIEEIEIREKAVRLAIEMTGGGWSTGILKEAREIEAYLRGETPKDTD